jgi:transketolase
LFTPEVELFPIRFGFGDGLHDAAVEDQRIVGLCADLTESTRMKQFADAYPERFIQIGVAEQNLAAVASGMAAMGRIPFISSYAMFSPGRNWEQIRTTIAYNNQPVKIIGSHAGISVGPDGGTHQAIEDIAIMRCIPRMIVLSPCDRNQAYAATRAAVSTGTPVYIRLAREKTPVITTLETPFELGKAQELWRSGSPVVTLITTGTLVYNTLLAAQLLQAEGIGSIVLNIHTIKPLDAHAIVAAAKQTRGIVTIEEHQIVGGLGSAVAEVTSEQYPVKIARIGIRDQFGQSGNMEELWKEYNLEPEDIVSRAREVIS